MTNQEGQEEDKDLEVLEESKTELERKFSKLNEKYEESLKNINEKERIISETKNNYENIISLNTELVSKLDDANKKISFNQRQIFEKENIIEDKVNEIKKKDVGPTGRAAPTI